MARALEANGAKVFILDLDSKKLDEAKNLSVREPPFDPWLFPYLISIDSDIRNQAILSQSNVT